MRQRFLLVVVVVITTIHLVVGPPVDPRKKKEAEKEENPEKLEDLGIEYGRYLEQVVRILEEDKDFVKKLENISQDQIKTGAIAHELEFVNHQVRSKLDEAKRMELDRLKSFARLAWEKDELGAYREADGRRWRTLSPPPNGFFGDGMDRKGIKIPFHVDYRNPHSFEVADLKKLMQTAGKDLEEVDRQRREDFKRYEMEKEHQYRDSLKQMNEEERKAAENKHKEEVEKHKDHQRVHHPGSKQQLEQVWEEQDHMPKEEFNPDLFFSKHDLNGDNFLDEKEVEAVLILEIKKMYESNHTEDDPVEMMEEYHRMREHIYNEVDKNRDHLISRDEFLDYTKRQEFERDEGWKGLDEQQIYTEEELAQYEREHYQQQQMQGQVPPEMAHYQFAQHGQGSQPQPMHPGAQYQHVPQQGQPQYQQVPQQGQPQYQQVPQQGQPQYQQAPRYQGQQGHPQPPQYHAPSHQQGGGPPEYHPQVAPNPAPVPQTRNPNQQAPSGAGQQNVPNTADTHKNLNENKL